MNFSITIQNFYKLSIGSFFFIATLYAIYFAIWLFPQWQDTWYQGWNNLNTIASSVDGVGQTVEPLSETAPVIVEQLKLMNAIVSDEFNEMNIHMKKIELSMNHMNTDVEHLAKTIPPMMGAMTGQLGRMQYNLTPDGFMNQMAPW